MTLNKFTIQKSFVISVSMVVMKKSLHRYIKDDEEY